MIGIQESIILIALIVFCFGIPLLLRGRYPLRQWLGILLCFVFGAVGQLYLAGGFLYFIGIGIANGIVIQTFRTVIVQEKMTDGEGLASMIIIWMLLNLFSARIMERRFKKLKTRANPATPLSANHDNNRPINPSANSNNARMTGSPVSSGSDTIPCPHCGETIKRIAKLCKHCRRNPTIIEEVICEYCGESTDGNADKCKHCDSSISPPTRKQVSASMPNKEAVEQETIENKEANRHDEMKQSEFKFNCPKCKQEYEADESMCGQTAECSNCNSVIIVPTPNKELVPKTVSANIQSEQARRKIIFTISLVLIIVFIVVLGLVTLVNSKCRENLDPQTKEIGRAHV